MMLIHDLNRRTYCFLFNYVYKYVFTKHCQVKRLNLQVSVNVSLLATEKIVFYQFQALKYHEKTLSYFSCHKT